MIRITTDMIAITGLSLSLVIGIVMGAPTEILTGSSGGLSGYVYKGPIDARKDDVK